MNLGEDRRGGFDAPTDGPTDDLQIGRAEFVSEFLEGGLNGIAKSIVVLEQVAAHIAAEGCGGLHEPAIALPGLRVEQLPLFLLGDALAGGSVVLLVLLIAFAPLRQPLFHFRSAGGEVCQQSIAELIVDGGADLLVAGSEA